MKPQEQDFWIRSTDNKEFKVHRFHNENWMYENTQNLEQIQRYIPGVGLVFIESWGSFPQPTGYYRIRSGK